MGGDPIGCALRLLLSYFASLAPLYCVLQSFCEPTSWRRYEETAAARSGRVS